MPGAPSTAHNSTSRLPLDCTTLVRLTAAVASVL